MCNDCDDSNITDIPVGPVGPTGPQGPVGPAPTITGTSTSSLLVATGSKTFITQSGIAWVQGQRLRAVDATGLIIMEGEVTSYSGTTLTLLVDYIESSGTVASWTISIAGAVGATGNTGATGAQGANGYNAFSRTTAVAISLGANLYTIPFTFPEPQWGAVGQIIYIESAGYYQITVVTPGTSFTVLDLLYATNTPAFMVATSNLRVMPAGIRGLTGANGSAGSTGSTGPTGPQGPAFNPDVYLKVTPTAIAAAPVTISIGTASATGTLYIWGQVSIDDNAANLGQVSIEIAGVTVPIEGWGVLGGPGVLKVTSVPICVSSAIVLGDTIKYITTLDTYTGAARIKKATLFYYIA